MFEKGRECTLWLPYVASLILENNPRSIGRNPRVHCRNAEELTVRCLRVLIGRKMSFRVPKYAQKSRVFDQHARIFAPSASARRIVLNTHTNVECGTEPNLEFQDSKQKIYT